MQFITFGFACTPLYFVWEKVIGMHDTKSICLRALARLPVVIPIWFLAIIFPFFGPINSAVGALLVSFTVYIIPSLAHMLTYRKASARQVNIIKQLQFLLIRIIDINMSHNVIVTHTQIIHNDDVIVEWRPVVILIEWGYLRHSSFEWAPPPLYGGWLLTFQ